MKGEKLNFLTNLKGKEKKKKLVTSTSQIFFFPEDLPPN